MILIPLHGLMVLAHPHSTHSLAQGHLRLGASSFLLSSWKCHQQLSQIWPCWLQPSLTAALTCLFLFSLLVLFTSKCEGWVAAGLQVLTYPFVPCSQGGVCGHLWDGHRHTLNCTCQNLLFSAAFPFFASFLDGGSKVKSKRVLVVGRMEKVALG